MWRDEQSNMGRRASIGVITVTRAREQQVSRIVLWRAVWSANWASWVWTLRVQGQMRTFVWYVVRLLTSEDRYDVVKLDRDSSSSSREIQGHWWIRPIVEARSKRESTILCWFEFDILVLQVRDEKGRRRLHGAFTGGFSAGYFNTVGSKEGQWLLLNSNRCVQQIAIGWTPSTFVSSRSDRAKVKSARPEDFMDDEDLAELRDSQKLVDTNEEMDIPTGGSRPGENE